MINYTLFFIDKAPTYPPPGYQPAPPQYQTTGPSSQTTVVLTAPQTTTVVYERRYGSGDHFLLLSIILSIWCCVCFSWWTLCCTIPAIFFAINAQEAEARGDYEGMQKNRQLALILDIAGVILGGVTFVVVIVLISVQA